MEFTSPNSNQTELYIPHQVWGHDLSNQIKNIHVENGVFIKNANKITHKPNQKIIVWYDILNTQEKLGSSYYTYIIDQGFYFLYKFALICPKLYTNDESIDVDIKFASHNDVFTNFGNIAANKIQKLNLTADNLISKGFAISGNHSILQNVNYKGNNIIFFSIDTKSQESLTKLLYEIINAQERFFETKNNDNLFVFINNHRKHNSFYGTLIGGNTVLYLLPEKFNVNDFNIKHLLAHENLHKWIGNTLIKEKEETLYKWFTEGFTQYFTDKINLTNGIVTFEEYLGNYNKILQKYYTSPYLLFDNETISKLYWDNALASELPYDRGYIIASVLDLKIQNLTNTQFSLDNLIKTIVANHTHSKKEKFTTTIMMQYINNITKNNLKRTVNKFVKYGNFDLSNFLNNSKLHYKKIAINDYGFDITNFQKIVSNLKKDSTAYKAGLRNNDKFKKIHISQENQEAIAEITIELINGRLIKYYAKKKLIKIPEYTSIYK
ncbi:hypothetical protein [Candidatus Tisiphia endosymbiont of Metellina segmentata]|uniref:M61 family metallopeptidase n=1 Tax=Candidatus Tisiphia endosymbiont of Metellina segmentata TaxID=3066274 RepID=UPI00313BDADC